MGFNRRTPVRPIPKWASTVGNLRDERIAEVRAWCDRCDGTWTVDLHKLEKIKGRDYSLYNRRSPCKREDCTGTVKFSANRIGSGMWPVKLAP